MADFSLTDLMNVFRRRRLLAAACAVAAVGAAALASTVVQRNYKCSTRIEVRSVQGMDTRDIVDHSRAVQEKLRNRVTFERLVTELGLDKGLVVRPGDTPEQARAGLVENLITATPVRVSEPTGGLFYIVIESAWRDADTAFRVTEGLAALYRNDVEKRPVEDAEKVVENCRSAFDRAEAEFKEADQALAEHETRHAELLTGAEKQVDAIRQEMRKLEEVEIPNLERSLKDAESRVAAEPRSIEDVEEVPENQERLAKLDSDLRVARQALRELTQKFTESHPQVIAKQAEVADYEAEMKRLESQKRKVKRSRENEAWKIYETERLRLERDLRLAKSQLDANRRNYLEVKAKADELPPVRARQETLRQERQAKLGIRDERRRALDTAVDKLKSFEGNRAVNYTVVDPALRPRAPSGPGPFVFVAGGLVAGIALGIGVGYLLELQDKSFREVDGVTALLGVPTLGAIHAIETPQEARASAAARTRKYVLLGVLAAASAGCVLYAVQADRSKVETALGSGR